MIRSCDLFDAISESDDAIRIGIGAISLNRREGLLGLSVLVIKVFDEVIVDLPFFVLEGQIKNTFMNFFVVKENVLAIFRFAIAIMLKSIKTVFFDVNLSFAVYRIVIALMIFIGIVQELLITITYVEGTSSFYFRVDGDCVVVITLSGDIRVRAGIASKRG